MGKIIKIVVIVFVGLYAISQVIEYIDKQERKAKYAERSKMDPRQTIGGKMVENAIKAATETETIEAGDDVQPTLNQPYRNEKGEECVFSRNMEGGIQVHFKKGKVTVFNLEKIHTGVYDTYRPNDYINFGIRIRMIDGGQSIEVTQDETKTIYTLAE